MSHTIIQADVLKGLASLPDESVQCVVTSPPYWGLRDYSRCDCSSKRLRVPGYGTFGAAVTDPRTINEPDPDCPRCHGTGYNEALRNGQIGLEKTPEEYVEKMVQVFREVRRVLRKDGVLWLNMGDCYAGSGCGSNDYRENGASISANHEKYQGQKTGTVTGLKPKDLVGVPWRLAFGLQADGWWLRCDVVWAKPNPMPESVTDRPTKAHEYIFLLTKAERYFYDGDAVREPLQESSLNRALYKDGQNGEGKFLNTSKYHCNRGWGEFIQENGRHPDSRGRNLRSVWQITTQPFPEAHFATFPEALVEPCIKAGTSERGACQVCGIPWRRVVEKGEPDEVWKAACGADSAGEYHGISHKQQAITSHPPGTRPNDLHKIQNASDVKRRILEGMRERVSTWEPGCTCGGEPVPCVVLDPFGGSGTVAKVARDLGRSSVSIEINPAYVEMMKKRLRYYEQLTPEVAIQEF